MNSALTENQSNSYPLTSDASDGVVVKLSPHTSRIYEAAPQMSTTPTTNNSTSGHARLFCGDNEAAQMSAVVGAVPVLCGRVLKDIQSTVILRYLGVRVSRFAASLNS